MTQGERVLDMNNNRRNTRRSDDPKTSVRSMLSSRQLTSGSRCIYSQLIAHRLTCALGGCCIQHCAEFKSSIARWSNAHPLTLAHPVRLDSPVMTQGAVGLSAQLGWLDGAADVSVVVAPVEAREPVAARRTWCDER